MCQGAYGWSRMFLDNLLLLQRASLDLLNLNLVLPVAGDSKTIFNTKYDLSFLLFSRPIQAFHLVLRFVVETRVHRGSDATMHVRGALRAAPRTSCRLLYFFSFSVDII